jgi:SHS2 domain-containing protein
VSLPRVRGPRTRAGHELVDHTSEVTIRLRAPTFPTLVAEATRAFAELVPPETNRTDDGAWREFTVEARDRAAGLVEWLNEIVYLCEVEQWLPVDAEVSGGEGDELRVRARGVRLAAPFVLVKAATLHNATVHEGPRGFVGEVTLDI